LLLSPERTAALQKWVDKEIVLGIRPEGISLSPQGRFAGTQNSLPAVLGVVEPLGEKMDLYLSTPRHPHLVARVDAQPGMQPNQSLPVYLDMRKAHLFEPGDRGNAITAP